jgi:polyphosphate kinase
MFRNLSKRIELVTPVYAPAARKRLWECLDVCLRDRRQAWELSVDGSWSQLRPDGNGVCDDGLGTHQTLMNRARERV